MPSSVPSPGLTVKRHCCPLAVASDGMVFWSLYADRILPFLYHLMVVPSSGSPSGSLYLYFLRNGNGSGPILFSFCSTILAILFQILCAYMFHFYNTRRSKGNITSCLAVFVINDVMAYLFFIIIYGLKKPKTK